MTQATRFLNLGLMWIVMAGVPLRAVTVDISLEQPYDGLVSLTLDPCCGTTLTGSPGDVVGWGFTLTTDGTHGILIDASDYCTVGPPFASPCTSAYTDLIGYTNGISINAGDLPIDQNFQTNSLGFGSLVVPASSEDGQLVLYYTITDASGNPLTGQLTATIGAPVDVAGSTGVPEPSTWVGAALGILVLAGLFARKGAETLPQSCFFLRVSASPR